MKKIIYYLLSGGDGGYINTIDAFGGEEFALEHFNFIIGQGVGLFNNSSSWSGNLNFLSNFNGYW